jgi:predicted metal-dependent HD superfamily phosphohydrolase
VVVGSDDRTSLAAFTELARSCALDAGWAARMHADLVERHAEPHRRYHVLAHVDHVLRNLALTAEGLSDDRALRLAAWYHDAVYDPRAGDNEAASAALARAQLNIARAHPALEADVVRLVLATAGHRPEADDERALCDADLAVLGASPEAYERYRSAVRSEYGFLDDDTWRVGRAQVLRSLLDAPLFTTAAFADREAPARRNLSAELDALAGPSADG